MIVFLFFELLFVTDYHQKKNFYGQLLTIYGRKPVLEALQDRSLNFYKLHLADSNKGGGIIAEIIDLAEQRQIDIEYHEKKALSRISRNGKQDQGVAADIRPEGYQDLTQYLETTSGKPGRLIALDGITNPQNLGMIVRSASAGDLDGIIWSRRGNAALGPLVIKASVGTLYRAPILTCPELPAGLEACRARGMDVYTLEAGASQDLFQHRPARQAVYVLGNESEGVSGNVKNIANHSLSIPMSNGVESLNVAVTSSLIAYATYLER